MQNSLRSDSCIFASDADFCELRISRHPANAIRGILFPECTCPGSRSPSKAYLSDYKKLTFTVLPDFSRKKPENIQILYSEAISRFSLKEAVNHS